MSFGIPVRNGLAVGLLASTFLSSLRIGGRPAMFLNFIGTNSLDSRVTFTRGTTATFVGSDGFIQSAAVDAPRFDYDPVTLAPKGLLIEEARTNLTLNSSNLSAVSWSLLRATNTINSGTAPDNTNTANLLLDNAVSGTHVAIQLFTKAASPVAYAASIFLKAGVRTRGEFRMSDQAGNGTRVVFNLSNGTVGTPTVFGTGFTLGSASVVAMKDGWYRVILTTTSNSSVTLGLELYILNDALAISYVGNGSGFYVWGAQLEAGAFATSYIPTVAAAVPRSADVAQMTGTNFSSWYNQTEGTIVAGASTFSNAATDKFVANINNNGFPNRILMNFTATNTFSASLVSNSVTQVSGTNGTAVALNTPIKMGFATIVNNFAFSRSGIAPTTDSVGDMPVTVDRLWIGSAVSSAFLNGHVRFITYYNTRLPNTTLQALTT